MRPTIPPEVVVASSSNRNHDRLPSNPIAPVDGSAVIDSLAFRQRMGRRSDHCSPTDYTTGRAGPTIRARPPADVPSSSSSPGLRWTGEASPRFHPHSPRNPQHQQQKQQQKQQQQQQRERRAYEQHPHHIRAHAREMPSMGQADGGNNVIHGLHMDHVLNNRYGGGRYKDKEGRERGSHPSPPAYNATEHLRVPLEHVGGSPMNILSVPPPLSSSAGLASPRAPPGQGWPPTATPSSPVQTVSPPRPADSLPPNTVNDAGEYVIEGTFQNRGCLCQTADDVAYLFGCGTPPQDEVVYVYDARPRAPEETPAARADKRNLWYHRGPDHDVGDGAGAGRQTDGGGPTNGVRNGPMGGMGNGLMDGVGGGMGNGPVGGMGNIGPKDNINEVLFQIDAEYQAMKAVHEGNMGLNTSGLHNDFLRDPPDPPAQGLPAGDTQPRNSEPPHGHYRVVHDDDNHTRAISCSCVSGLVDIIMPGGGRGGEQRQQRQQEEVRLLPVDPAPDHPAGSPYRRPLQPLSPSHSSDGSSGSFDRAKRGVAELKGQLKALVHDRARWRAWEPAPPGELPKEARQEPTPPGSPARPSSPHMRDKEENERAADAAKEKAARESAARLAASEAEIERLRSEARSLDAARRSLQEELEAHRSAAAEMEDAARKAEDEREAERLKDERGREAERLREKQRDLERSREELQRELERHRAMMVAANAASGAAGHSQQHGTVDPMGTAPPSSQYNIINPMGTAYLSSQHNAIDPLGMAPLSSMSMGASPAVPAVLSPLTAASPRVFAVNVEPTPANVPMNNGSMNATGGMASDGAGGNYVYYGMTNGINSGVVTGMNSGMDNGMNNGSGMMGTHNSQALQQQQQQRQQPQQQWLPQRTQPLSPTEENTILQDANSIIENSILSRGFKIQYTNKDPKTLSSKSIYNGGEEPSLENGGKFIDNIGGIGVYPSRPKVSPKASPNAQRLPPSSRDQSRRHPSDPQPPPRHPPRDPQLSRLQGGALPSPNNKELSENKSKLHDLKVKNELIGQDIARMRSCMRNGGISGGPSNRSPFNYRGGVNVALGARVNTTAKPSLRPFSRTSPPSSPRGGHGRSASSSPRGSSQRRSLSDQRRSQSRSGRTKPQPPNPMRQG